MHEYVIPNLKKGDYVMLPREEFESMKATIETLEDKEVMGQLRESVKASSKSLEQVRQELSL